MSIEIVNYQQLFRDYIKQSPGGGSNRTLDAIAKGLEIEPAYRGSGKKRESTFWFASDAQRLADAYRMEMARRRSERSRKAMTAHRNSQRVRAARMIAAAPAPQPVPLDDRIMRLERAIAALTFEVRDLIELWQPGKPPVSVYTATPMSEPIIASFNGDSRL